MDSRYSDEMLRCTKKIQLNACIMMTVCFLKWYIKDLRNNWSSTYEYMATFKHTSYLSNNINSEELCILKTSNNALKKTSILAESALNNRTKNCLSSLWKKQLRGKIIFPEKCQIKKSFIIYNLSIKSSYICSRTPHQPHCCSVPSQKERVFQHGVHVFQVHKMSCVQREHGCYLRKQAIT